MTARLRTLPAKCGTKLIKCLDCGFGNGVNIEKSTTVPPYYVVKADLHPDDPIIIVTTTFKLSVAWRAANSILRSLKNTHNRFSLKKENRIRL